MDGICMQLWKISPKNRHAATLAFITKVYIWNFYAKTFFNSWNFFPLMNIYIIFSLHGIFFPYSWLNKNSSAIHGWKKFRVNLKIIYNIIKEQNASVIKSKSSQNSHCVMHHTSTTSIIWHYVKSGKSPNSSFVF